MRARPVGAVQSVAAGAAQRIGGTHGGAAGGAAHAARVGDVLHARAGRLAEGHDQPQRSAGVVGQRRAQRVLGLDHRRAGRRVGRTHGAWHRAVHLGGARGRCSDGGAVGRPCDGAMWDWSRHGSLRERRPTAGVEAAGLEALLESALQVAALPARLRGRGARSAAGRHASQSAGPIFSRWEPRPRLRGGAPQKCRGLIYLQVQRAGRARGHVDRIIGCYRGARGIWHRRTGARGWNVACRQSRDGAAGTPNAGSAQSPPPARSSACRRAPQGRGKGARSAPIWVPSGLATTPVG